MEPWEDALDLDDSDIPNLLRPCKRQHSQTQTQTGSSPKSPIRSSFRLQSSNPKFTSPTPTQPPADSQPHFQSQSPLPAPEPAAASSSGSRIPGPAGALQAAMNQRSRDRAENSRGKEPVHVSTQEYMRRVEEKTGEDFTNNSLWTSALEFLSRKGVARTKPLSDIKKRGSGGKIDTVVALVESCTPNGLGDMMVVLKDPTDTIAASIHRKVLAQGGYAREMLVGSVLILEKVSVFCPSHRSYYLNISLSNVVEVFSKDQNTSAAPNAKNAENNSSASDMPELQSSCGRPEGYTTPYQQNCNLSKSLYVREPTMGMENCGEAASPTITNNDESRELFASLEDQNLFQDNSAGENISKKPVTEDHLVDLNFKFSSGKDKLATEKVALGGCTQTDVTIPDHDGDLCIAGEKNCTPKQGNNTEQDDRCCVERENLIVQNERQAENSSRSFADGPITSQNGFKNHIQQHLPPPNGLIQEWTDEQLDILDMDDDF